MTESATRRPRPFLDVDTGRRRSQLALGLVASSVIVLLIVLLVTGRLVHGIPWGAGLTVVVVFLAERVFSLFNSRCPSCNAYLDTLLRSANFCPKCGTRLAERERKPTVDE